MYRALKVCFFSSVFCAFASAAWAEPEQTLQNEPDANALIAKREGETLLSELTDLVVRCEAFYEEVETLPENESTRRALDLAARFENLLGRFPDSVPAMFFFAEFLYNGGENERAEKLLLKAEKADGNFAPVQILLAEIFASRGAVPEAFLRFRRGIADNPDSEAVALYGEFLCDNREALLAKKIFKTREELDKDMQRSFFLAAAISDENPDYCFRAAESFYDVENPDWKLALAMWESFGSLPDVKKNPETRAAVALHRARVLAELGRIEEANTLLRETVDVPALERSRRQVFEIIKQKREKGN